MTTAEETFAVADRRRYGDDDRLESSTYVKPLVAEPADTNALCVVPDEQVATDVIDALEATRVSTVIHETTADGALDQIPRVDVVVCALELPDAEREPDAGDGLSLLDRVRSEHGDLPVVMLDATGEGTDAAAAVNRGANGFVTFDGHPDEAALATLADRVETVVSDFQSRRRFENATALLCRLTEYTDDTLWMFTGDWSETVVINAAYETVWHRSKADLIEDPADFMEAVHPEDVGLVEEAMATLSGGEVTNIEYRISVEGEYRWVSVHAEPVVENGEVAYVAGFTRDVTDRREREQTFAELSEAGIELSGSESRTEAIEKTLDIATTVLDESVVVYWEPDEDRERLTVTDLSGAAELLAGDAEDLVHERGDPVWEVFERGETVVDNDFDPSTAAIDASLGSVMFVPVGDHGLLTVGDGDTDAYTDETRHLLTTLEGMLRTTLDRLAYERQLQRSQTELERSNESLQQFAYVASHDLQEPLRMVSSYVSLLESEYGDQLDEEASEYMEFAVDGAERMQDMIDALLQYSRVQTQSGEFREIDPESVLEETTQTLTLSIEETDASVDWEPLPTVIADPDQLGQVFQNLIGNAITYTVETGTDPIVEITGEVDGERATFRVTDNGPGIPAEEQADLFDIFKRGATDEEGTGIGLALCQRIVHRHDGELWIESEAGEGASFCFTLPVETGAIGDD